MKRLDGGKRLIVKGHALRNTYCYDTVSHETQTTCECGWSRSFGSKWRAREAHREHKAAYAAQRAEKGRK